MRLLMLNRRSSADSFLLNKPHSTFNPPAIAMTMAIMNAAMQKFSKSIPPRLSQPVSAARPKKISSHRLT